MAVCWEGRCGVEPTLVAMDQGGIGHMASDGSRVFWANLRDGRIVALDAEEDAVPEVLAETSFGFDIGGLALDTESLYVAHQSTEVGRGGISRIPKNGGKLELVIEDERASDVVVTLETIYWSRGSLLEDGWSGAVLMQPKSEGEPTMLALAPATELALDGTDVFFRNPGRQSIERTTEDPHEPMLVAEAEAMYGALGVADGQVYFGESDAIFRVPAAGGERESLVPASTGEFVLHDGAVYCQTGDEIVRFREGASLPLARVGGFIGGIVVAGGALYWGDFNEDTVWRLSLAEP